MTVRRELLTLVSPLSLESWYRRFCGSATDVTFLGEEDADVRVMADLVMASTESDAFRILSGHDSLLRDWALACELRSRGTTVTAQSGMAMSAGLDKLLQKRLLSLAEIPVPSWGLPTQPPPPGGKYIWKGRSSTQSRGIRWHNSLDELPTDGYWEEYIAGVEYSVVLHRESGHTVRFPPVYKGATSESLRPPWKRLRLVPAGIEQELLAEIYSSASTLAELLDINGFAEIEYIVTADGTPLVTDINPRVCGTMRIVAMATGIPIFDPSALRDSLLPDISQFAAEIPYEGAPLATPRIVATSRLTCTGDTPRDVFATLAERGHHPKLEHLPRVWHAN